MTVSFVCDESFHQYNAWWSRLFLINAGWLRLFLINAGWSRLFLINAGWLRLFLINAGWLRLFLIRSEWSLILVRNQQIARHRHVMGPCRDAIPYEFIHIHTHFYPKYVSMNLSTKWRGNQGVHQVYYSHSDRRNDVLIWKNLLQNYIFFKPYTLSTITASNKIVSQDLISRSTSISMKHTHFENNLPSSPRKMSKYGFKIGNLVTFQQKYM